MKNKIWVVIPGYNESKYLDKVLTKCKKYHPNLIFIDDGSSDSTFKIAKKHTKHALRHKINLGKGAALKTACIYAFEELGAEAVILMDSDDQHDAAEIKNFIKELKNGHELILGTREVNSSMPFFKRMANKSLSGIVQLLFGTYVPDIPSGYKAFSKNVYKKISWNAVHYDVEAEMAVKIAQSKIPFNTICIKTIYHDMNKGMSFLDAIKLISIIINRKIGV